MDKRTGRNRPLSNSTLVCELAGTRAVENEVNIYRLAGRGVYDCGIVEIILIAVPAKEELSRRGELISSRHYVEKCFPLAICISAEIRNAGSFALKQNGNIRTPVVGK